MKIIEGLKQIKDLARKADDLKAKIGRYSAHMDFETPTYADQKNQVVEWVQGHSDILKEILRLRIAIQKTNLAIDVTIELGDKSVTKCIAEWIHRRRDLAYEQCKAYQQLSDRDLKEGTIRQSNEELKEVKIIRCYDPLVRDKQIDVLQSEPSTIDSKLEIINAITDLVE